MEINLNSNLNISYCMVYVTTKNEDEAIAIGKKIVELRLAACANIVDKMVSLYHWKGAVHEDNESIIIFKTRMELFKDLEREVINLHSYEVPCIVAYPIIAGSKEYLKWLEQETKKI